MSRWYGRWIEASPAEVGYDAERLEAAIGEIGQLHGVQGLLLVRRGYLVAERYWRGGARDVPHNLKSASKSIISALIGIAIGQGHLRLDQPIAELLPGYGLARDPAKSHITVRHLLSMTSGLQSTSYQAYNDWVNRPDWIRSVLAAPQVSEPGARYSYNTANTHLLSAILAGRTGEDTRAFAQRRLFDPMGVEIYDWMTDPNGIHIGGNNLWLMPRDLAKFGQLYLDQGRWGDRQLVSADWVAASTRPDGHHAHETYGGYGYLWWTPNGDGSFAAVGYGGQYILVSPRDDTVVVVISTLASKGDYWEGRLFSMLRQGIGGSLVSPQLPPSVVASAAVDLHSAPQAGSRALKAVSAGERLELFGRAGDWLRVRSRGEEGWLHSEHAELQRLPGAWQYASLVSVPLADDQPDAAASAEPGAQLQGLLQRARAVDRLAHAPAPLPRYRTTAMVNFRRSPNLVGELVGQVPPETEFQPLEHSEAWLMTVIDGQQGWIHSDYAKVIEPPSPEARYQEIAAGIAALVDEIERLGRLEVPSRVAPGDQRPGDGGVQRLNTAMAELEQMRTANQSIQDRLSDAERVLDQIQQKHVAERSHMEGELLQSRQQATSFATQLSQLREQAAGQAKDLAAIEAENAGFAQRLAVAVKAKAELEQALSASRSDAESLAKEAAQLRGERQALQRRVEQFSDVERQYAGSLDENRQQFAQLRGEFEQVISQQRALDGQLQDLITRNAELDTQLDQAQQRNRQLVDEMAAANTAAEGQRQLIVELRAAGETRDTELTDSRQQIAALQAAVDDRRRTNRELSNELNGLRSEVQQREKQLALAVDADRQRQQELADIRAQAERLQAELEQNVRQHSEVSEQLGKALAENQILQQQLADGQQRLALSRSVQDALEQALNQSWSAQAVVVIELDGLRTRLEEQQAQVVALRQDKADQSRRVLANEARVAQLQRELADAQAQEASLQRDLEQVREQAEARQAQLAAAGQENEASQNRIVSLETELQRQQAEAARLQDLLAQVRASETQAGESLEKQTAELASAELALRNERAAWAEVNDELGRLRAESAAQQQQLADFRTVEEELQATRSQLAVLKRAADAGQQDSQALLADIARFEQAEQQRRQEMAALAASDAARAVELESTRTELAALRQAAQAQQARLKDRELEHRDQLAALTAARDKALSEADGLRERLEQDAVSRQALLADIARLEEAEQQRRQENATLAASDEARAVELESTRTELAALRQAVEAQQARLKGQELEHREQLAALTAARDKALSEADGLQGRLEQDAVSRQALLAEIVRLEEAEQQRRQENAALAASDEARARELEAALAELAALRQTTRVQQAHIARLEGAEKQRPQTVAARTENKAPHDTEPAERSAHLSEPRQASVDKPAQDLPRGSATDDLPSTPSDDGSEPVSAGTDSPQPTLQSPPAVVQWPSSTVREGAFVEPSGAASPIAQVEGAAPRRDTSADVAAVPEAGMPPAAHIKDFVHAWATAWSRQDVDAYLSYYADDFRPRDGASRVDWAQLRRQRVLRPKRIDIEVSGFEIAALDTEHARVTFEQAYRADHYQDRVSKTLELRLEDGRWKILREISNQLPAQPG